MQLPLGCYSVSIRATETLTVQRVKSSENSRRVVQAQTKGVPSSVSCLQQQKYVDAQRKERIRQVHALKTPTKTQKLPFPAFKYFQFRAFPESNLLLNPYKPLLHPQLSLASSYMSVACCVKSYFLFLVFIASPTSLICWLLVLVWQNSLRLKNTLKWEEREKLIICRVLLFYQIREENRQTLQILESKFLYTNIMLS